METLGEPFRLAFSAVGRHLLTPQKAKEANLDFSHGQNRVPVSVRIPVDLHRQLVAEAERAVRTVSNEIVFRLRRSMEQQSETGGGESKDTAS
jgi:hypothetical protein